MQQVGDDARDITVVAKADLGDATLRNMALNQGAYVIAGTASINFDPDGWKTVEGFVCSGEGHIADPITDTILHLPYGRLTQLFNKYGRGDYEGAPGTT